MNNCLELAVQERLAKEGPLRVAVIGAGASGQMIIRHLAGSVPWIRLMAVASRKPTRAIEPIRDSTGLMPLVAETEDEIVAALTSGRTAVTERAEALCRSELVEIIVEVTGTIEFGASIALNAIKHDKHVVLVNAELDSTLGPILKAYADAQGVVLSHTDGEEPGVAMTLLRYLKSVGLQPVAAGNLKGMIDRYRTPETQRKFAADLE